MAESTDFAGLPWHHQPKGGAELEAYTGRDLIMQVRRRGCQCEPFVIRNHPTAPGDPFCPVHGWWAESRDEAR